MPYLSISAVAIHYEEALYQVHAPLPLLLMLPVTICVNQINYLPLFYCTFNSNNDTITIIKLYQ